MLAYPSVFLGADRIKVRRLNPSLCLIALAWMLLIGTPLFGQTPAVGAKAPDFTLSTPSGKAVKMSANLQGHALVLVVLRGFPGYQCPYCVKQVHDFVDHATDFAAKNTRVLLVYPGPPRRSGSARQGVPGKAGRPAAQHCSRDGPGLCGDQSLWPSLGCAPRNDVPIYVRARQEGQNCF